MRVPLHFRSGSELGRTRPFKRRLDSLGDDDEETGRFFQAREAGWGNANQPLSSRIARSLINEIIQRLIIRGQNRITGDEEMDNLTTMLRCPQCGASFPVELHKMRVNVANFCPSCGYRCGISEDQAIRAHRLLERLEYRRRIMNPQSIAAGAADKRSDSPRMPGKREIY